MNEAQPPRRMRGRSLRRFVLGLPALGLLVATGAACAPFHAGAAAIVGDNRVSTTQLRGLVDRGIAAEPASTTGTAPATRAAVTSQALTNLIQLGVLKKMAADAGVKVTTQDIDAALTTLKANTAGLVAEAATQGIAESDLPLFAERNAYVAKVTASLPVSDAAIASSYQANIASFAQVQISGILVSTLQQADEVATDARSKGADFAALAEAVSSDATTKNKGGDFGYVADTDVATIAPAAATAKTGTIIVSSQTQTGYYVFRVGVHRTLTLEQATPQVRTSLQSQLFAAAYDKAEAALHISVSPRFGVWDPKGDSSAGLGAVGALPQSDDLSVPTSGTSSAAADAQ